MQAPPEHSAPPPAAEPAAPPAASPATTPYRAPLADDASWPATRAHLHRLLHPLPGEVAPLPAAWRVALALLLAALFGAGVLLPYLWPTLLPAQPYSRTQPTPGAAATPANLPAGTRLRDCADPSCPWLVVIPAGTFTMGSPATETGRYDNEGPQHQVTVPKAFALMETEVTVGLYRQFVAETGYQGQGSCYVWNGSGWKEQPDRSWKNPFSDAVQQDGEPVVCISWNDAQVFAEWMSRRTGQVYRLPSEAEWEYAARAGTSTAYSFGDQSDAICQYANVADQSMRQGFKGADPKWIYAACDDAHVYTAPVGSYLPNAWGLFDMHGNAWEWTQDCLENYQAAARQSDPVQNASCSTRALRGGGWLNNPVIARSAIRFLDLPSYRSNDAGLRLARMLP